MSSVDSMFAHRAPLLWLLLPYMAGLATGNAFPVSGPMGLMLVAGLLCAAVAVWRPGSRVWSVCVPLSVFCTGVVVYDLRRNRLPDWENLPPREVRMEVQVERLFAPGPDSRKVSGLAKVVRAGGPARDLAGQLVYFSGRRARGVSGRPVRSARIALVGRLDVLPRNPPANTFDGYLAGAGVNFKLTAGRLLKETAPATPYWRFCAAAQQRLADFLGFGLEEHPALAGEIRAMLLGAVHELSEEQEYWFKQSGTFHLFSISGLHIGVIAAVFRELLKAMRVPALPRFVVASIAVWLYVDINGRVPSAVRSFFMFGLYEGSRVLRVPGGPHSALVVSALGVLLVDPMELFSASFQLSYGIVGSLLVLGAPLAESWTRRFALFASLPPPAWTGWHRTSQWLWKNVLSALALGLSSSLVSAVLGILYFGLFTPGALLANLMMIPVSMAALVAGVASLLAALIGEMELCLLFNHGAALVFLTMEKTMAVFVGIPGVSFAAQFCAPWVGFAVLAGLIGLMLAGFHAGWPRRWGGTWLPFAYTGAALTLLVTFGKPG